MQRAAYTEEITSVRGLSDRQRQLFQRALGQGPVAPSDRRRVFRIEDEHYNDHEIIITRYSASARGPSENPRHVSYFLFLVRETDSVDEQERWFRAQLNPVADVAIGLASESFPVFVISDIVGWLRPEPETDREKQRWADVAAHVRQREWTENSAKRLR